MSALFILFSLASCWMMMMASHDGFRSAASTRARASWWAAAPPPLRAPSRASRARPSWRRHGQPSRCGEHATREALHSASSQQASRAHLGAWAQRRCSTRDRDRARDRQPQHPSLWESRCYAGCSARSHGGCYAQHGAVPATVAAAGGDGPRWHLLGPKPHDHRACE